MPQCSCEPPCVVWTKTWGSFADGVNERYQHNPTDWTTKQQREYIPYNYSDYHSIFWLRAGSINTDKQDLTKFSTKLLYHREKVQLPFILMSSDGDLGIHVNDSSKGPPQPWAQAVLDSPLLRSWYAQNALAVHPRLHALPIGIDPHSTPRFHPSSTDDNELRFAGSSSLGALSRSPTWPSNARDRWSLIQGLAAQPPPREQRSLHLFTESFDPGTHYGQAGMEVLANKTVSRRLRMVEVCKGSATVLRRRVSKVQMLELYGRSQFVLSPPVRAKSSDSGP